MNEKITSWLKTIIIFAGALYLGILSWNAVKAHNYIGVSDESKHSIAVSGEGEASAIPDIAKIQLGFSLERKTVAAAQAENTAKINEIIKKLKEEFKIEAKDMKTENYSINPRYDWRDGRQILRGYEVSQSLSLKIRQLDDISLILDAAGAIGLNQIGNLSFEIDEPESLKSEEIGRAHV